jgi:outer membrane murein-binding lipoprotein Lpp
MDSAIICALISGAVTLVGSLTTWRITAKKDQGETRKQLKAEIDSLKEDVTGINATFQQHIAVIDVKIDTLSARVEKHNQVMERTFKLEQAVEDLKRA